MTHNEPGRIQSPSGATVEDTDLDETEVLLCSGTRLTEARAEQMVAESPARAGADNLNPGRRSLSGDGTHSPRLQLRVPRELHDAAAGRAREEAARSRSSSARRSRNTTVGKLRRLRDLERRAARPHRRP